MFYSKGPQRSVPRLVPICGSFGTRLLIPDLILEKKDRFHSRLTTTSDSGAPVFSGRNKQMMRHQKRKLRLKRKYQGSCLSYGFIATGDTQAPHLLCRTCGDRRTNEAMKPSKPLCHIETKHHALKYKPLEFFGEKKWKWRTTVIEGHHFNKCVWAESIILGCRLHC